MGKYAGFPPPYKYHWRAGPYQAPNVSTGATLHDEYRGEDVVVEGMTKTPIPWPGAEYNRGGRTSLLPILCGDLVRAICEEDEVAVSHYWGVTRYIVERWKQAISGAKDSDGVFTRLAIKRLDPEFRKRFGYT